MISLTDIFKTAQLIVKALEGHEGATLELDIVVKMLFFVWLVVLTVKSRSSDRFKAATKLELKAFDEECKKKQVELTEASTNIQSITHSLDMHKLDTSKDIKHINDKLESLFKAIKDLSNCVDKSSRTLDRIEDRIDIVAVIKESVK